MKLTTVLFFFVYCLNELFAQQVTLTDQQEDYKLYQEMLYYEDPTGKLTIDEIKKIDKAKFTHGDKQIPNLGMTKSAFWVYFKVKNSSTESKWVLLFDNININLWELYSTNSNGENIFKTGGSALPFHQRDIKIRKLNTILPTESQKTNEYYIKITGQTDFSLPLYIQTEGIFYKDNASEENNYFLYFGIIATLVIFNFFIFFMIKDNTYLFYILATTIFTLGGLYHTGFIYQYIFPSSPWIQKHFIPMIIAPYLGFWFAFSSRILKIHTIITKYNIYKNFIYVILIIFFLKAFILPSESDRLFGRLLMITVFFFLINIAISSLRRGNKTTSFYLTSWTFLLVSVIIALLAAVNILPSNSFTVNAPYYGSALEHITLSLALVYRYRSTQLDNIILEKNKAILALDSLTERMKPHFLFNSLNTIYSMIQKKDKKAEEAIIDLSNMYRFLTNINGISLINFSEEWIFIENYLTLMKHRHGDNFIALQTIDINSPILKVQIPPLTVQPLVENCFKHNNFDEKNKLKIAITVRKCNPDGLEFIIENNLCSSNDKKSSAPETPTFQNIKKRLEYFYKNVTLDYCNVIDHSTCTATLCFSGKKDEKV